MITNERSSHQHANPRNDKRKMQEKALNLELKKDTACKQSGKQKQSLQTSKGRENCRTENCKNTNGFSTKNKLLMLTH